MALQGGYSLKSVEGENGYIVFTIKGNKGGWFERYSSIKSFWKALMKLSPEKRCYYETIRGDSIQRPRFDIDMKKSSLSKLITHKVVLNDLIYAIIQYASILDMKINKEQIQVYSSHGDEKYSYHIVLTDVHHKNHEEANMFYQGVHYHIPSRSADFIDNSVYKSLQQFRFYGNTKRDEFRPKVKAEVLFNDQVVGKEKEDPYEAFLQSLIVPPKNEEGVWIPLTTTLHKKPIANVQVDFSLISSFVPTGYILDIRGDVSRGYKLQRINPSYCYVCNRIHENENAYLRLTKEGVVILKCFRDLEQRYALGIIENPNDDLKKEKEISTHQISPLPKKPQETMADEKIEKETSTHQVSPPPKKPQETIVHEKIEKGNIRPRRNITIAPKRSSSDTLKLMLLEIENRKR